MLQPSSFNIVANHILCNMFHDVQTDNLWSRDRPMLEIRIRQSVMLRMVVGLGRWSLVGEIPKSGRSVKFPH